jgi:hypothetical protein
MNNAGTTELGRAIQVKLWHDRRTETPCQERLP